MPYVNGSITDEELEEFSSHIEYCRNCREELEIYLTVDAGVRHLDEGTGSYSTQGVLEAALELSRQKIHTLKLPQITRYAVNILCFWVLLIALMLQFRL